MMHIISLGAGVQSSTMALMAARKEILPTPLACIFADTQDESADTYRWLNDLEKLLPFPLHRVSKGKLSDNLMEWNFSQIPAYQPGSIGKRQCTKHYKVMPIRRKMREMGIKKATLWMGISFDEVHRMKPANVKWIEHRWPLIEKRMKRDDCLDWLERHDYPIPPKSSCLYCPYKSDSQWRALKANGNGEWSFVVSIDRLLNQTNEYLHKSCKPIDEVDFRNAEDMGQLNMFGNECEGMCGV